MSNKGTFMLRKNIALILSILTLLSAFSVIPMTATAKSVDSAETGANIDVAETGWTIPTEVNFASRLATLKKKYYPRGYSGAYYEDGYAMAWQCYGYACQMLKEVFGIKYYADDIDERLRARDYDGAKEVYAVLADKFPGSETASMELLKIAVEGHDRSRLDDALKGLDALRAGGHELSDEANDAYQYWARNDNYHKSNDDDKNKEAGVA